MTLTVLSTLAVERALNLYLLPAFTRQEGEAPEVSWNPTTVLMDRIRAGERADAIILIDGPMAELVRDGIVVEGSVRPVAIARIGVAVAPGAPVPDLGDVHALKAALLAARSVAYSRTGASGIHFANLIERLGVAGAVNARATIIPEGFTARKIVTGEADLAIQQVSELMTVDGIHIAGELPEGAQLQTAFSAAVFKDAADPEAAGRFVDFLVSAEARAAYLAGGLAPRFGAGSAA